MNVQLQKQNQQLNGRITELNQNIKEICQNSQHLFLQIQQLKTKLHQCEKENDKLSSLLQVKVKEYQVMTRECEQLKCHCEDMMTMNANKYRMNCVDKSVNRGVHVNDHQQQPYSHLLSFKRPIVLQSSRTNRVRSNPKTIIDGGNNYDQNNQQLIGNYNNRLSTQPHGASSNLQQCDSYDTYRNRLRRRSLDLMIRGHSRNYKSSSNNQGSRMSLNKCDRNSISTRQLSQQLNTKNTHYQSCSNFNQHHNQSSLQNYYNQQSSRDIFLKKLNNINKNTKRHTNTERQPLQQLQQLQVSNQQNQQYLQTIRVNNDTSVKSIIKQKSSLLTHRKNLMTSFNLNNQIIQKNILKLQKTASQKQSLSSKNRLRTKQELNKKDYSIIQGLSPINQQLDNIGHTNDRRLSSLGLKEQRISSTVYQNCKKILYNQ